MIYKALGFALLLLATAKVVGLAVLYVRGELQSLFAWKHWEYAVAFFGVGAWLWRKGGARAPAESNDTSGGRP